MPRARRAAASGPPPRCDRRSSSPRPRSQARARLAGKLVVPDLPCLDDALLPVGHGDERAELDDLRVAEVLAEPRPHLVVRAVGVPDQHARVEQGGLLPRREAVALLEVEQVDVIVLGQTFVPPTEGPLRASVLAGNGLRDIDAAELLERM